MRTSFVVTVLLIGALFASACTGGDDDGAETSIPSTTISGFDTTTTTTDDVDSSTTSSTSPPEGVFAVPSYTIVERIPGSDGDVLVIQLDPGSYDALDSEDLINVVADVVDRFPPVLEMHIVDSPQAAELVLGDNPTAEEAAVLADHYFVRLEDGARIVFVNTFSEAGQVILGS